MNRNGSSFTILLVFLAGCPEPEGGLTDSQPRTRQTASAATEAVPAKARVSLVINKPETHVTDIAVEDKTGAPVGFSVTESDSVLSVSLQLTLNQERQIRLRLFGDRTWSLKANLLPQHTLETFDGLECDNGPALFLRDYGEEVELRAADSVTTEKFVTLWLLHNLVKAVRVQLVNDGEEGASSLRLPEDCRGWLLDEEGEPQPAPPEIWLPSHSRTGAVVEALNSSPSPITLRLTAAGRSED